MDSYFEDALPADGAVVCPVGLDEGALGAVPDLVLHRPHRAREVLGDQQLVQGQPVIVRALDAVELGGCQVKPGTIIFVKSGKRTRAEFKILPLGYAAGRREDSPPVRPDEEDEEDVVEDEKDDLLGQRVHCDEAEVDDVGVVGPDDDRRDEEDGDPLGRGDAVPAGAAVDVRHLGALVGEVGVTRRSCWGRKVGLCFPSAGVEFLITLSSFPSKLVIFIWSTFCGVSD